MRIFSVTASSVSAARSFPRFSLRSIGSLSAALVLARWLPVPNRRSTNRARVRASRTATAGASGATSASDGGSSGTLGIELNGSPQYYRVVRLTNAQWAQSVQDILGLADPSGLEAGFQSPVAGTTDFSNNELLLDVNQRSWEDFQTAAEALADQVTSSASALSSVYSGTDSAGFIKTVGRRAYRRPLSAAEVSAYGRVVQDGQRDVR